MEYYISFWCFEPEVARDKPELCLILEDMHCSVSLMMMMTSKINTFTTRKGSLSILQISLRPLEIEGHLPSAGSVGNNVHIFLNDVTY